MARNKYNVDETLDQEFSFQHFKRAFVYVKRYKKLFFGAFFFSLASTVLGLLMPLFTQNAIDVMIPNKAVGSLIWCGVALVAIVASQAVCNRFRSRCTALAGQAIIRDIRRDLYVHLQDLPFDYFDSRPHGKILVRIINYVNSVSDFLTNGLVNIVLQIVSLVIIAVFMIAVSPKLSLLVFAGLPVFAVYIFLMRKKQRRAWQLQANKHSNFTAYLSESINGEHVTQSFSREAFNQNINTELYEAAGLDGANVWQKFKYVTVPQLKPTTFFVIIMLTINCFKVYDIVCMLAGGSNGVINKSAIVLVYYIYEEAFRNWNLGIASAGSLVLFAIVLAITIIQFSGEKNYSND